ncbi:unnamed protein product [Lampetra planeri]
MANVTRDGRWWRVAQATIGDCVAGGPWHGLPIAVPTPDRETRGAPCPGRHGAKPLIRWLHRGRGGPIREVTEGLPFLSAAARARRELDRGQRTSRRTCRPMLKAGRHVSSARRRRALDATHVPQRP